MGDPVGHLVAAAGVVRVEGGTHGGLGQGCGQLVSKTGERRDGDGDGERAEGARSLGLGNRDGARFVGLDSLQVDRTKALGPGESADASLSKGGVFFLVKEQCVI